MRTSATALGIALALFSTGARADNAAAAPAGLSAWTIDTAHSKVEFSVAHLVISEVEGQFKKYSGKVQLDEKKLEASQLEFSAEVSSVDTGEAKRDEHLKSPEFFDAAKFPQITFKSTQITKAGKGYKIKGDLTIRGVTKPVTLDATLSDAIKSPFGNSLVRAAHLSGKIDRREFGITWNKSLDKGGAVVGDTVELEIKLEINRPGA